MFSELRPEMSSISGNNCGVQYSCDVVLLEIECVIAGSGFVVSCCSFADSLGLCSGDLCGLDSAGMILMMFGSSFCMCSRSVLIASSSTLCFSMFSGLFSVESLRNTTFDPIVFLESVFGRPYFHERFVNLWR